MFGGERGDLVGAGVLSWLEDDEGAWSFPGFVIGNADDGRIGNRWMGQQQRLELGRRDLESLELDQLLDPIDDRQVAVLVDEADVAGMQPAVFVDRVGGCLRVVQVPLHHLRSTHPHLADAAHVLVVAVLHVHDPAFGIRHGDAAGAGLEPAHPGDVGYRAQLGHSVALHHLAVDPFGGLLGELCAERCGSGENLREAGEIETVDHGVLRESKHDRRDSKQPGDLVLLNQAETLLEIEARDRHDGRSLAEEEVHQHLHAVNVEERQHCENDLTVLDIQGVLALDEVRHQVLVRQHDALGESGRSRRVRQNHDLLVEVDIHLTGGLTHQGGKGLHALGSVTDDEYLRDACFLRGRGGCFGEHADRDQHAGL